MEKLGLSDYRNTKNPCFFQEDRNSGRRSPGPLSMILISSLPTNLLRTLTAKRPSKFTAFLLALQGRENQS